MAVAVGRPLVRERLRSYWQGKNRPAPLSKTIGGQNALRPLGGIMTDREGIFGQSEGGTMVYKS